MSANLEVNKIAGAILLAGVLAMVSGTVAKIAFGGYAHEGHEEGAEEHRGFKVDVVEEAAGGAPAAAIDIGTLLAAATVEQGAAVVKKCAACHDFTQGGPDKVGPNLYGVLGGPHAHRDGFQYSDAMKALHGEKWDIDSIWHFLNNPASYVKGTKMAFAGLKKPEELAAAIVYLRSLGSTGVALPAPKVADAAAPAEIGKGPADAKADAKTPAKAGTDANSKKAVAEGTANASDKSHTGDKAKAGAPVTPSADAKDSAAPKK